MDRRRDSTRNGGMKQAVQRHAHRGMKQAVQRHAHRGMKQAVQRHAHRGMKRAVQRHAHRGMKRAVHTDAYPTHIPASCLYAHAFASAYPSLSMRMPLPLHIACISGIRHQYLHIACISPITPTTFNPLSIQIAYKRKEKAMVIFATSDWAATP